MPPHLSERERQLVELAAQGFTDKEICSRLDLSAGTVGTYWSRCREKLGVPTRAACVAQFLSLQAPSASDRRWEALLGLVSDAVLVVSADGRVVAANHVAATLASVSPAELIGLEVPQSGVDLIGDRGQRIGATECPIQQCFRDGIPVIRKEYNLRGADGRVRSAQVSVKPLLEAPEAAIEEVLLVVGAAR